MDKIESVVKLPEGIAIIMEEIKNEWYWCNWIRSNG
jgi:hypothetical protein